VDSCNVANWIQKILLHCAVLIIVIAVEKRENSCNVVNWIPKIILHCAVLLIVRAVEQCGCS